MKSAKEWLQEYERDHEINLDEHLVRAIQVDALEAAESACRNTGIVRYPECQRDDCANGIRKLKEKL